MRHMFYVYILHSKKRDLYYIGYSDDPDRRIITHNTSKRVTYISKYRPWEMVAHFPVSEVRGEAMKVERFLKKQKSRKLIEEIIVKQKDEVWMAPLVSVPARRD